MDELALQTLDRLQSEEMVIEEGVGVSKAGHNTPLGLILAHAGVLLGEGAEELHHHLAGLLAVAAGQEHLVQQTVELLPLLRGQLWLALGEHSPGAGHVRVHRGQLTCDGDTTC